MPRPVMPKSRELLELAKGFRELGITHYAIESRPDGVVLIDVRDRSEGGSAKVSRTPLEAWRARHGAA